MQNLRDRQIQIFTKMLTISNNNDTPNSMNFSDQWKVLIYDNSGRDIISPLMSVGFLRQKGVTLHLNLHANRDAVPDAPAIYFVEPTEQNLERIAEDCDKKLYRKVYLNFITPISRTQLEFFAKKFKNINNLSLVTKIYDQYFNIISLNSNLFSLNIPSSFFLYNNPKADEASIKKYFNKIALHILSLVNITGIVPIIRAPPGGAAEMLAHEVCSVMKEYFSTRNPTHQIFENCLTQSSHSSSSSTSSPSARPVLVLFDRSLDLFPLLTHSSSYLSLIHDLLPFHLNKVTIDVQEKSGQLKPKSYDLNPQTDSFLSSYSISPFPEAIEANEKELQEVQQKETQIRSSSSSSSSTSLSDAIENLPEILNKKANLEQHTNIMQSIMKKIISRDIPTFFELEQEILTCSVTNNSSSSINKENIIKIFRENKGSIYDRSRLLLIFIVVFPSEKNTIDELINEFKQGVTTAGSLEPSPAPGSETSNSPSVLSPEASKEFDSILLTINFIRSISSTNSSSKLSSFSITSSSSSSYSASSSSTLFNNFLSTASSKASSLISKASLFFLKFIPYYLTRILHTICDGKEDSYIALDPLNLINKNDLVTSKYNNAILFVLGGGCYSEYFNICESLSDKNHQKVGNNLKSFIYGCTELINGEEFLKQFNQQL